MSPDSTAAATPLDVGCVVGCCLSCCPLQHVPPISVTFVALINVLDINERPVLTPSRVLLDENSPVGFLVGYPIIVRDQDVDRPGSTQLIKFSLGPLPNGSTPPFVIDQSSGQIQVSANVLDYETLSSYSLTVIATDDGVPSLAASTIVTVTLRYAMPTTCPRCRHLNSVALSTVLSPCVCRVPSDINEAPTINATLSRFVTENAALGTTLVPLGAVDQDANAVLTYVATYPPEALGIFIVDNANGTVVITGPVDYERKTSYTMTVPLRFMRTCWFAVVFSTTVAVDPWCLDR